jgi:hypothetical protein
MVYKDAKKSLISKDIASMQVAPYITTRAAHSGALLVRGTGYDVDGPAPADRAEQGEGVAKGESAIT